MVEKLLFSLTFYIYYSKIFRTFQIICLSILAESGGFTFNFSLTFYIYYKAILKLFQISICGNADENEVVACGMRAENLTNFFKFRTNVRSWKFDFKSQILGGLPTAPSRSSFSSRRRSCPAAPSCSSFTAHTCGAWPRHMNVCSERMFAYRTIGS